MELPFFSGEYELTIDPKNRLLIPAKVRSSLDGTSLIITVKGSVPWIYPCGFYKYLLSMQITPTLNPNEPLQRYKRLTGASTVELEWDNQGRVVLPSSILGRVELGKEVTLVGSIDHLELWSREKWIEDRDQLVAESDEIEDWALKTLPQLEPVKKPESGESGKA
ncbi:MAG: hypothetical protein ABSB74_13955 [Tepidisphaeraceae bacterium]